ncbi:MAG: FAD-binding protein [Caulobacteraceae bacterium]|nr:FAD-binding protein [Caulobacteraceae bacterium]
MRAPVLPSPETADDLIELVANAARDGLTLEIRGGGSKAQIGAPRDARLVDMSAMSGVIDYDPAELVLTAKAGTPLAQVEALVASEGQMLAFDPFDHGPLLGRPAGAATIGGVVAGGVAGSRRISAGGARDHLLGFHAVSGRGERFVAGAKVVKNVTGYDLPKLAAGSWGRLFAMTEVTLKVLPRAQEQATVALDGLSPLQAQGAMAMAMGSQADVQAAAHIPAEDGSTALTVVRLEGFGPSVVARIAMIQDLWSDLDSARVLPEDEAAAWWGELRHLTGLADGRPLWRINTPPSGGPKLVAALQPLGARWRFDWAGGLTWLTIDGQADAVRAAAHQAGGHAMLVRADAATRAVVPALHPQAAGVAALEARVRLAFDPKGVFETGRFLDGARAD